MKRNLHFFAAAVATISLLASCAEEMTDETTPDEDSDVTVTVPSDGMVTLTFKADYPNPVTEEAVAPQQAGTRTTIAENGTVAWEIGDEITLYYMEGNTPANAPATALTAGASADFQVTIPDGVTEVYAVYPAGKGELTTDGVFKVKTGEAQNGSFEQANYAAAWTKVSDEMNISFKNVVGLFKVKLPEGGIIKDGEVNHTIKSIAIAGKKAELAFLGDVAVTLENGALSFSDPENASAEAVIELDTEARNAGYVYIPSLPVTSADGLVFRFQNTEGKYLPAAVTKDDKAITLERGHLKPVNTACESVIFDWYFAEKAEGDGKSADSPAGVAEFQKLINDSQYLYGERRLDGARLNLAAGTYSLTEQLNIKGVEAGDITIVGAGLDESIIDGSGSMQLIRWVSAKNLRMSHLTLQNGKTTSSADDDRGAAIYSLDSKGKLVMNDCKLYNNVSGANSGAILLCTEADFRNCIFDSNKSKKTGGAFAVPSTCSDNITIDGCSFINNQTDATNGGAIYNGGKGKLFVNRSFFKGSRCTPTSATEQGVAIDCRAEGSELGVYNCTFNDNSATANSAPTISASSYVVANSTFVEANKRSSYGVICNMATSANVSTVVNNIVIHSSGYANHVALGITNESYDCVDSGYNLLKGIKSIFVTALSDKTSYSGTNIVKTTFGFTDPVNNVYTWDGNTDIFVLDAETDTKFAKCTLTQVETLVKNNVALGEEFWNWLKDIKVGSYDATQVDMLGVLRDPNAMWPGSYQAQ